MEHGKFESFFRANYQKAYFLALRLLRDEEASRDAVSDSFERVLNRMRENSIDFSNAESYLYVVVRNACLEHLRKQQLHNKYAKLELHQQDKACDSDMLLMERERKMEEIMASLNCLPLRTRQIVKACYVERKKYREAAGEFGISESAVKKHIMQALSFLRQKFKSTDP
ncbi:MAG: sigma-70 family RNA polymerase sigma factor [Prevotella sp.]